MVVILKNSFGTLFDGLGLASLLGVAILVTRADMKNTLASVADHFPIQKSEGIIKTFLRQITCL